MSKLKCTNPKTYNLRKDKEYLPLDESKDRYLVTNEAGLDRWYAKSLFAVVNKRQSFEAVLESISLIENDVVSFEDFYGNTIEVDVDSLIKVNTSSNSNICHITGIRTAAEWLQKKISNLKYVGKNAQKLTTEVLSKCVLLAVLNIEKHSWGVISFTEGTSSGLNDIIIDAIKISEGSEDFVKDRKRLWVLDIENYKKQ